MKKLKNFKEELNVIQLEERLEMVNIAATEVAGPRDHSYRTSAWTFL